LIIARVPGVNRDGIEVLTVRIAARRAQWFADIHTGSAT
jgi:hypothetical protein